MATRAQDISRFLSNYHKFIILIGIALTIQFFLALRVVLLPGTWDVSGDGSKGPSYNHNQGSQKHLEEGQIHKFALGASENNNVQDIVTPTVTKSPLPQNSSLATLDLDSLTFVPECNITLKDSISAIHRAKTQICKEEIAHISCEIVNDVLYSKRLPRFCSNTETIFGRYIGCFKDNPKDRLLSGHLSIFKDKNSPQTCIDLCLQSGFQYAGVQYGVECFCGNSKPPSNAKLAQEKCDFRCPSESSSTNSFIDPDVIHPWNGNCGGYFAMDVFETGVFLDYELNNKIVSLDGLMENGRLADKPERDVQIVYFLTLNGRSARQVFRLIKALFHQRHYFYIHVDSRQDYLFRELRVLSNKLPDNVRFMSNRKATIWGGASLLTILLSGMEDLVVNSKTWNWNWDYVINLSESDFPLKTTEKLTEFLSHNNGRNFVKSHGRDVQKFIQKQGLDKTFYECEHRMWRVADRKLPAGIMIDGGSDWIALHKDFVEYVIVSDDNLVAGLKTVFQYTLLPAESFFHTVLRNSYHCRSFVDNNLHVTNWKRKLGCKCQYRNVVDWCGCSPNDFRLADWNRLLLAESRILFFGRKFEAIVSQEIINKLESWLYPYRFEAHYPTLDRFWLSLYHFHDLSPKPDDTLVTLGRSLARIAAKNFAAKYNFSVHSDAYNDVNQVAQLVEITAYSQDDEFQGVLIRFNAQIKKPTSFGGVSEVFTVSLESWFHLENHLVFAPWSKKISKYRSRIQDITIGAEYDQKEQIFRNFARSIGPFSEPVLAYDIASDEAFNITAVFVDPSNNVQAVQNGSATDASGVTTNFIKPVLKTPLQTGNWTVKVLTIEGYLLAEVKMLVLPLEIHQGKPITASNAKLINLAQSVPDFELNDDNTDFANIGDLQIHIDTLVSEFYTIRDFCLENEQNHLLVSKLKTNFNNEGSQTNQFFNKDRIDVIETSLCNHAQWSSLFPDPKSSITGIDPDSGLLLP